MCSRIHTVPRNRLQRCVQNAVIRVGDLDQVQIVRVDLLENVSSGWQHSPWDLNRCAECDGGGLIGLVGMRGELKEHAKCDQHTEYDVELINSHCFISFENKFCYVSFTVRRETCRPLLLLSHYPSQQPSPLSPSPYQRPSHCDRQHHLRRKGLRDSPSE